MKSGAKIERGTDRMTMLAAHPVGVVVGILTLCFACELAIMAAMKWLSINPSGMSASVLDASFLTLGVAPALWWLVVRPLRKMVLKEQARASTVVSNSLDAIVTMDDRGMIETFNPAAEELFGYAASEVLGTSVTHLMPVAYRDRHETGFRNCMRSGKPKILGKAAVGLEALRIDGKKVPIELSVSGFLEEGRQKFVGVIRNVSERKRAEAEAGLLKSVAVSVLDADSLEKAFQLVLRDVCGTVGWPYGEAWVMGEQSSCLEYRESWFDKPASLGELAEAAKAFRCARGEGLPGRAWAEGRPICLSDVLGDATFTRADIARKIGLDGAVGVPIMSGRNVMGVLVFFMFGAVGNCERTLPMLTAVAGQVGSLMLRKHAEKAAEEDRIKTAKLGSVAVLAGGIAHDFNNILTAVIGNLSVARREVGGGTELHAILSEAESASRRAKALTHQLLTFARGGGPVRRVVSVEEIVRSSSEFASSGTGIRCEFHCAADLWAVDVDPGQIQQVVQNLVVNAVQATPAGGIIRILLENLQWSESGGEPSPRPSPFQGEGDPSPRRGEGQGEELERLRLPLGPGRYVKLEVADAGSGIAPEHLAKVYDPYFTTKPTGSGLGLAVCHSIVKNHGGHIEIRSEVGKGTSVRVYLPASEKRVQPESHLSQESIRGKGRVLVMDDEAAVRSVAARMLKSLGYEVELAADGKEAIDLYSRNRGNGGAFDAVLMDLTVSGGMGGREATTEILKLDPEARVLVSSGYSEDPIMARFSEYGFKGRVPKPYSLEELSRVLREVLSGE